MSEPATQELLPFIKSSDGSGGHKSEWSAAEQELGARGTIERWVNTTDCSSCCQHNEEYVCDDYIERPIHPNVHPTSIDGVARGLERWANSCTCGGCAGCIHFALDPPAQVCGVLSRCVESGLRYVAYTLCDTRASEPEHPRSDREEATLLLATDQ